ncbi:hypothetical protein B0H19DRAFT_1083343 [Mycena capillaripes]|nr:hypothetical protein B0H19DRAFT_1083343 [Mycena capillaripes]
MGSTGFFLSRSKTTPRLKRGDRAGRLYIGTIDAIVDGAARLLKVNEINTYTLRASTAGELFCDVFWDAETGGVESENTAEPFVTNASSPTMRVLFKDFPLIDQNISSVSLAGQSRGDGRYQCLWPHANERPKFTGAGTDIPMAIATDRAMHNPTGWLAAPGVRDVFLRFLHSVMAQELDDVPGYGTAWPRAKTFGEDGRFCEAHLNLREVCGIIPCGLAWERQYTARFSRLTFPGVRCVIRRQQGLADDAAHGPTLHVSLPSRGDIPGNKVIHTLKPKQTCCLQMVQLACGYPIGWGKCYRFESTPQALAILNRIWEDHPNFKPSLIAYDDACDLLRHIIAQNPDDPWIASTNSLLTRGTTLAIVQISLVEQDANTINHQTRPFNPETAEQLNSWLDGFESQLRHIYVRFEKQVAQKDLGLSDDFWVEAFGE